jgi:23S rRNA pseudouridine1911/1915/1917 synthase
MQLTPRTGDRWVCGPDAVGWRLDRFLAAQVPDASRSKLQQWIEQGCFTLNGGAAKKKEPLKDGDVISVISDPVRQDSTLVPEDLPVTVVYEDDCLIVVDKPKDMVTHPGNGIFTGTLANALAYRFGKLSDVNGPMRPGLVHRLDKDTSGLLVAAKDNATHLHLARQLEAHNIRRVYHALVWREMSEAGGSVDLPIARNPRDPLKMAVNPEGKRAVTHYKVLGFYQFATYLEVNLETGRTHQIRVHLSHSGFPVVGDALYGGRQGFLGRMQPIYQPYAAKLLSFFPSQALHAHHLSFVHPATGKPMEFTSPLPKEMIEAVAFLEKFRRQ